MSAGIQTFVQSYFVRLLVVVIAAALLYVRMPGDFRHPQFWAEDVILWNQVYIFGIKSLVFPLAGYFLLVPRLLAQLGTIVPLSYVPAFYIYAATLIDLMIVYLATSPRLDLPLRPLVALSIVATYAGNYALVTLANLQWVLPIGVFILIFMKPATKVILVAEIVYVLLTSVTGIFSIFLGPIALLRAVSLRHERPAMIRLLLLGGALCGGAVVQAIYVLCHLSGALIGSPHIAATWMLWTNMVFHQLFSPFGDVLFFGLLGVVATFILAAITIVLALKYPFRPQKLAMLFFGMAVVVGGMIKSGVDLGPGFGLRYFYILSVFSLWFICCVAQAPVLRPLGVLIVIIIQVAWVRASAHFDHVQSDLEWSRWSQFVDRGLPFAFPAAPNRWYVDIPVKSPGGRYTKFTAWIGRDFNTVTSVEPECIGTFDTVGFYNYQLQFATASNSFGLAIPEVLWLASGRNGNADDLIAFVDSYNSVLGFAFSGFKIAAQDRTAQLQTRWHGIFPARVGETVRAYAVRDQGQSACLLQSTRKLQKDD
jgi:hypothetical protein